VEWIDLMKLMPCPLNGPRNISEFACAGEVSELRDPSQCDDAAWTEHVIFSNNTAGVVREWWFHMPTSYWFIAERNTTTDEILRTYPANEVFKERFDYALPVESKD
jgi:sarcosine oxidase subunit delta